MSGKPPLKNRPPSKKVAEAVEEQQELHHDKNVELWSQDEARLGLKPIVRRVWALRGKRPLAHHHTRYEGLYVYLFICPTSGQSYFLILPRVSTELMSLALREFAQDINPDQDKTIALLLDNAGWHTAKDLEVPPGIVLLNISAYTLKLSPAETVVPLIREAAANQSFTNLKALQNTLDQRCTHLIRHPDLIRAVAGFAWLPHP